MNRRTAGCRSLRDPRITISDQGTHEISLVELAVLYAQLRNVAGDVDFLDGAADALRTAEGAAIVAHLH